MKRFYEEFGRNLRHARQREGAELSQEKLAKRVGMSRTSITNIEKGRQQIPLHMLYSLADALGLDPVALLPDKRKFAQEDQTVVINLSELPADIADFVGRISSRDRS
jgi:transcriptional regulator with XRE-family HTH domain